MGSAGILAAFLRRDWAIDFSYRTVFAFRILASFFTLALFFYLGKVIDDTEFAREVGVEAGYFGFVAVGIAIFTIVESSTNSFSRKLREEQTTGTFETLMSAPAPPSLVILASAAYEILRGLIDGLLLIALAIAVFGLALDTSIGGLAAAVGGMLGALVLFASIGVAVAAFTVIFKRATALVGAALAVLSLLSGVYFPVEVLPGALQAVGEAIPFTWALDVLRASLLGGEIDSMQLFGLLASAALLLPTALLVFRSSVNRARRSGSLADY